MYDEKGRYVGVIRCEHYDGVARFVDKECCGGRVVSVALLNCKKLGEVDAGYCAAACVEIKECRKLPARA